MFGNRKKKKSAEAKRQQRRERRKERRARSNVCESSADSDTKDDFSLEGAVIEVRCTICDKIFDIGQLGMEPYDLHMKQEHGVLTTSSNDLKEDGCSRIQREGSSSSPYPEYTGAPLIKQEPLDLECYGTTNTEKMFSPYPISLTKTSLHDDSEKEDSKVGIILQGDASRVNAVCSKCKMGFLYKDELSVHKLTCTGKVAKHKKRKASTVKSSAKSTSTKSEVKMRIKKTRSAKGVRYEDFDDDDVDNNMHKATTQHENNFYCKLCDKTLQTASGWRRHKLKHAEKQEIIIDDDVVVKKEPKRERNKQAGPSLYQQSIGKIRIQIFGRSRRKKGTFSGRRREKTRCRFCGLNCGSYHFVVKHERAEHGKSGYTCRYCNKIFNYPAVMRTHERIHTGERPFQCEQCPRKFSDSSSLRRHRKLHKRELIKEATAYFKQRVGEGVDFTDPKELRLVDEKSEELGELVRMLSAGTVLDELKYSCEICHEGLHNKYDFLKHMSTHTGQRPYQCSVCNKGFFSRSHLRSHEIIHTGEKPYECKHGCGKRFNAANSLKRHEALHSGAKICKCKSCDESFNTTYQLRKHIDVKHDGVRPYRCTYCPKGFLVKSHLTEHIRIHTKEKPYTCSFCSKPFGAANSLKRHEKIHTNDRQHKCDQCEKAFICPGDLKKHLRTHSTVRPYVCDVENCDKSYKFASDLRVHKERHSNPEYGKNGVYPCTRCDLVFSEVAARHRHVRVAHRRFTKRLVNCKQCEKGFRSESYLNVHEKTHHGDSVSCEYCGALYVDARLLAYHLGTHDGLMPYTCEYCQHTAPSLTDMRVHMRTHSTTPYNCRHCDKSFSHIASRLWHENTHTGNTTSFDCPSCDMAFETHDSLTRHTNSQHKQKDKPKNAKTPDSAKQKTKIVIHFPKGMKNKATDKTESDKTSVAEDSDNDSDDNVAYLHSDEDDSDHDDNTDKMDDDKEDSQIAESSSVSGNKKPTGEVMADINTSQHTEEVMADVNTSQSSVVASWQDVNQSAKETVDHHENTGGVRTKTVEKHHENTGDVRTKTVEKHHENTGGVQTKVVSDIERSVIQETLKIIDVEKLRQSNLQERQVIENEKLMETFGNNIKDNFQTQAFETITQAHGNYGSKYRGQISPPGSSCNISTDISGARTGDHALISPALHSPNQIDEIADMMRVNNHSKNEPAMRSSLNQHGQVLSHNNPGAIEPSIFNTFPLYNSPHMSNVNPAYNFNTGDNRQATLQYLHHQAAMRAVQQNTLLSAPPLSGPFYPEIKTEHPTCDSPLSLSANQSAQFQNVMSGRHRDNTLPSHNDMMPAARFHGLGLPTSNLHLKNVAGDYSMYGMTGGSNHPNTHNKISHLEQQQLQQKPEEYRGHVMGFSPL